MDFSSESLADNFRKARLEKNLSQLDVAKKINVSQNAYSKIELSITRIKLDRFFQIADCLDLDYTELLKSSMSPKSPSDKIKALLKEKQLIERALTESRTRYIEELSQLKEDLLSLNDRLTESGYAGV